MFSEKFANAALLDDMTGNPYLPIHHFHVEEFLAFRKGQKCFVTLVTFWMFKFFFNIEIGENE